MPNKFNSNNILIPKQTELKEIAKNNIPVGYREEKQRGTNCSGEFFNYIDKKGNHIKLFVKKSFLRGNVNKFQQEYQELKSIFKNIVPNQSFINIGDDIFAFCAPIGIKIDILLEKNHDYIIELLKLNKSLLKQLKFFIRTFEKLQTEKGKIIDLYGTENLIISNNNKLYYIDSFLIFQDSDMVKSRTIKNIEYLKMLIDEAEENNNI